MFEFLGTGQFNLTLGKSFEGKPKKKGQKFFNVKNLNNTDFGLFGKDAKLEKQNDAYQLEMKHAKRPNITYNVSMTADDEYDCILIYDEETKTFTIERQNSQINILSRKLELPTALPVKSPLPVKQATVVNEIPKNEPPVETPDISMTVDDFDFDISKDMDAILDSDVDDDEEEKSDSDSGSDIFEEIAAPVPIPPHQPTVASPLSLPVTPSFPSSPDIPLNLALPSTPVTKTPINNNNNNNNNSDNKASIVLPLHNKKRKLKMASAPIRHPGVASPLVTSTPITNNNLSPNVPPNHVTNGVKRPKLAHPVNENINDTSSSGSSDEDDSSSGSESGSTETDSSSGSESGSESGSDSDSDSDDDDFESLAQDISMSLSKGGPSAPSSPLNQSSRINTPGVPSPSTFRKSPYDTHSSSNTPTPTTRPSTNGGGGPMSLRALFNDQEDDDEESSGSDSESSSD